MIIDQPTINDFTNATHDHSDDENGGTLSSSVISDFSEAVDDRVATLIQDGTGISWTYVDGSNTLTGNVSLSSFSTTNLSEGTNLYYTDERVDDRVSNLLQNSGGIAWTYDDLANTLTPDVTHNNVSGLQGGTTSEYYHLTSAQHSEITTFFASTDISATEAETLTDGSNADLLHVHTASGVSDFSEAVDDRVATLIQNGTDISWTYVDGSNTLTGNVSSTLDSVTGRGAATTNAIGVGTSSIDSQTSLHVQKDNSLSSTDSYSAIYVDYNSTGVTSGVSAPGAIGQAGILIDFADTTTISDSFPNQDIHGIFSNVLSTGNYTANIVGSMELYGIYCAAATNGASFAGNMTVSTYGGRFVATGNTSVTSVSYGILASASGSDTNWAGFFSNGNVYIENNLGIGISPSTLLHVTDGGGTVPSLTAGTVAVFQNNDDVSDFCHVSIIAGESGQASLYFGDSADDNVCAIFSDLSESNLKFRAGGTGESFRIESDNDILVASGNKVGIGVSPAYDIDIRVSSTFLVRVKEERGRSCLAVNGDLTNLEDLTIFLGDIEGISNGTLVTINNGGNSINLTAATTNVNGNLNCTGFLAFDSDANTYLTGDGSDSLTIVVNAANIARYTQYYLRNESGSCQMQWMSGNAGTPGYSFNGDTNTGFYRIGADSLGFSTAASTRIAIGSDGRIICGNDNQTSASGDGVLEIQCSATGNLPGLLIDQNDTGEPYIALEGTVNTTDVNSTSTAGPDAGTWANSGMFEIQVNGTRYYVPYYSEI